MKQTSRLRRILLRKDTWAALLCLLFLLEQPVYAYIDPGAGSLMWQLVVAAFVGLLFYWRKFWSFFRIRRKGDKR